MKRTTTRRLLKALTACVIFYGGLALFSCSMADRMIFMPRPSSYSAKAPSLIHLNSSKGESIAAFYFPANADAPTVLYSHGNAEDIGQSAELYRAWQELGWGVMAYDYPGYGQSSGKPSEAGCERAIQAAWDFLTGEKSIAPEQIVVMGRSVGSGPSSWLAERQSPKALVLIAPFTSTFELLPPAQYVLPFNRFPNLRRIQNTTTPLLVIHGEMDRVIPISHGQRLHAASPATQKAFIKIPEAGHNDLYYLAGDQVIRAIEDFVGRVSGE